jgi:hypothetical protein
MITTAELHHAAQGEGIRFDQVEKAPDYERVWADWIRTSATLL